MIKYSIKENDLSILVFFDTNQCDLNINDKESVEDRLSNEGFDITINSSHIIGICNEREDDQTLESYVQDVINIISHELDNVQFKLVSPDDITKQVPHYYYQFNEYEDELGGFQSIVFKESSLSDNLMSQDYFIHSLFDELFPQVTECEYEPTSEYSNHKKEPEKLQRFLDSKFKGIATFEEKVFLN